jgi:hypothetical protein
LCFFGKIGDRKAATRQKTSRFVCEIDGIKETEKEKSDEGKKSFTPRATSQWNILPVSMRIWVNLKQFKKELKAFVREP